MAKNKEEDVSSAPKEGSVVKKCWTIDEKRVRLLENPHSIKCFAKSPSEARADLIYQLLEQYLDIYLKGTNTPVRYSNMPIIRKIEEDVVIFEGKEVQRNTIEKIKKERERTLYIDGILKNEDIKYCYMSKLGYYYCEKYKGFTQSILKAGVYSKSEAIFHAKQVQSVYITPIDVNQHNEMINEAIEKLKDKLLTP